MDREAMLRVARRDCESSVSRARAKENLIDYGLSEKEAASVLEEAAAQVEAERRQAEARKARVKMVAGAVFFLAGCGILSYTYLSAPPGGMYLIPGGFFALGLYLFWSGHAKV